VLAAISRYPELFKSKRVGLIISGGNVLLDDWRAAVDAQQRG
jgi:hypothetical protein